MVVDYLIPYSYYKWTLWEIIEACITHLGVEGLRLTGETRGGPLLSGLAGLRVVIR